MEFTQNTLLIAAYLFIICTIVNYEDFSGVSL